MVLVTLAGYLQLATLGLMLVGRPLFRLCGLGAGPEWYGTMMENKMQTFAFVFLANTLAASITATGAFEVCVGVCVCACMHACMHACNACCRFID